MRRLVFHLLKTSRCTGLIVGSGAFLWSAVAGAAAPLRVGFEPVADRLSHVNADGQPDGFAVEIAQAVARDQNLQLQPVVKPWPQLLEDFQANRLDMLGAVVASPERDSFLTYSAPHVDLRSAIFVRAGLPRPTSLADLRTLKFGTTLQSAGHEYIVRHGWVISKFYPRLVDALAGLDRGECDAVLAVRLFGRHFIAEEKLAHVAETDLDLDDMHYRLRFGVHRDAAALLAQLNDGLAHVHADGTYEMIYEKWIGPLEPRRLRLRDVEVYLIPLGLVLAAVIGALFVQRRLFSRLQRQAEALRASEERLTLVLEGSEDGFWDWDMRTNRMARSERWAAMLGYQLDEIPPTLEGGSELVHPDDRKTYEAFRARFSTGRDNRYDLEYRMKTKSGDWRWILDRGKIVARAADGTPLRMAGTHTDISERKRTERALIENRELLARSANLLEQTQAIAHIGGWEFDLATQRLYWSEETYRIHDLTAAQFTPTLESALEFYAAGESRRNITGLVHAAVRDGTPYDAELTLVTASGRVIFVHTTGRAERVGGRTVKIYGSIRDVTAEKAAEEKQEQIQLKMLETQKLESLGVLAGGIAHDFNNLLTVILANANFARDGAHGSPAESLGAIETAAHRAADLCRQMLAYAGHYELIIERFDLTQLVRDTARLLTVSISKKAELHTDLEADLPPVEGDGSQLRQVLMNLVINASEALGDNEGKITIRTCRAHLAPGHGEVVHSFELPAGECVCLEVSDTGCGMNAATLARIFDPFFTTKFTGRGLGLAAALGIVRRHRGALTAASTPGHGSTFRLFLPESAKDSATPFAVPPAPPSRDSRTGTVLIVDDEPAVLSTADVLLRTRGYQTVLATDGLEALEKFRAEPQRFTAVLVDLTMPKLDGAQVLREIRTIYPKARVLIMSGFSERDVQERLHDLGPVAFLHKPFTLPTLIAALDELTKQ